MKEMKVINKNKFELDIRNKIITSIIMVITIYFINFIFEYIFFTIFMLILLFLNKMKVLVLIKKIKFYFKMGIIICFFNIFFMKTGNLLYKIGDLKIYDKPFIFTFAIMYKILLLTLIIEIMTNNIKIGQFLAGINYFLGKRYKNNGLSLSIIISIQFINIIKNEIKNIINMQKTRGETFSKIDFINIKKMILIIVPLFRVTLEKVNKMVEILECKNFILNEKRTEYYELKWKFIDNVYFLLVNFVCLFMWLLYFEN